MAPDLGLRIMEDDSEEHPSVELAGDVQDEDLGVDNKQVELLEFTSSFMFPAEYCRGVLEFEEETWELIVLLRDPGGDLTVEVGALPDPPNSFPKGAIEEDDFTGGVELRIIQHEFRIQVFFDKILVLPIRITYRSLPTTVSSDDDESIFEVLTRSNLCTSVFQFNMVCTRRGPSVGSCG